MPVSAESAHSATALSGFDVRALFPQQPQRQDSLTDQLRDLYAAAVRLGLYDAADWLRHRPHGPERAV